MSLARHGPRRVPHGNRPGYWVHATARATGHASRVGPFWTATDAGAYVDEHRPHDLWTVRIILRNGRRR